MPQTPISERSHRDSAFTETMLEEAETLLALDEAAAEIERGEGSPAADVLARLREKLGVRRKL